MSIQRQDSYDRFTVLSTASIEDPRLSFKAVGLLTYLLSRPDEWTVHHLQLASSHADGAASVLAGLKELEDCGYLERTKTRGEHGRLTTSTVVYDQPRPSVDSPNSGLPDSENLNPVRPALIPIHRMAVIRTRKTDAVVNTDLANTKNQTSVELTPPLFDAKPDDLAEKRAEKERGMVERIFAAWVKSTGREKCQLDAKRRKLITQALAGYPPEDVVAAVRGWEAFPHNRGENERKTVYNDLSLLLRDAEHIERFRDGHRGRRKAQPPSGSVIHGGVEYRTGSDPSWSAQTFPGGKRMLPDGSIE